MTFHNQLTSLRDRASTPSAGLHRDATVVLRRDLQALLMHFDRLDADVREARTKAATGSAVAWQSRFIGSGDSGWEYCSSEHYDMVMLCPQEWTGYEVRALFAELTTENVQRDVVAKILDLIMSECRYWHGRDEARRGGFANLYAAAREVASGQQ